MPTAVYPGSLDPITFGHISAIADAAEAFGELIVAIGINPAKTYMFSLAEREHLARLATAHIPGVRVTSFSGLLVHYLVRHNLNIVVRGLRNGHDFDDALLNDTLGWQQTLAKSIKALYVPARSGQQFISSTSLKVVLKDQGNATGLAPLSTIQATQARMLSQYLYGITGPSGVGKSFMCEQFQKLAARRHIPLMHIDLDRVGHDILSNAEEPLYQKARAEVIIAFGRDVAEGDGSINRKALGQIVFNDPAEMAKLNAILHDPIFFNLSDHIRAKSGIFLIDAALLAESGRAFLVNNNILLVDAPDTERAQRLTNRDGLTPEQIESRLNSQYSAEGKAELINRIIADTLHGSLERIHNDASTTEEDYETAFNNMLKHIDIYSELRITGFFTELGAKNPAEAYRTLRTLHSGNERFYHGLSHITDGLNKLPEILPELESPAAFTLAWLFHDAVYNTASRSNEEDSAVLLETLCTTWGIEPSLIAAAKLLIMATKHGHTQPKTTDERYMADLDLSILGHSPEEFAHYEAAVRREYPATSSAEWRTARTTFLQSLKSRKLFTTKHFAAKYEAQAQENILKSLSRLDTTR